MINKLHTKPAFDTLSNLINYLETISKNSFLTITLALFTFIASTTIAQAELVDSSDLEPVVQVPMNQSYWSIMPSFKINEDSLSCLEEDTGEVTSGQGFEVSLRLQVDEAGNINKVDIVESSGNKCLDRSAARQVKKGRLKPFLLKGKAVVGRVTLPIRFVAP